MELEVDIDTLQRRYREAMQAADRQYAYLTERIPGSVVVQTGGMCLAVDLTIGDYWIWVTDTDGPLPWGERPERYAVGAYRGDEWVHRRDLSLDDAVATVGEWADRLESNPDSLPWETA